jgi:hypothetical protein
MEEVSCDRAENHFGTHLPAPPILGINDAKLFLKSYGKVTDCRPTINPAAPRTSIVVNPDRLRRRDRLVTHRLAPWESLHRTLYSEE